MRTSLRPPRRGVFALAGIAAATLMLSACGSTGGGTLTYDDSPLLEYLNVGYDPTMSDEERQAEAEQQDLQVQEVVAACMTKLGFEYTPFSNSAFFVGNELDVEWGSKEFAEKYGYGVFTDPWGNYDLEQQQQDIPEDPNEAYAQSLSESERIAYEAALWGDPNDQAPTIDDDGNEYYEWDWSTAGCYGAAQHEVYGESIYENDEFTPLMERMNEIYLQAQTDPRTLDLANQWASCMADAGFAGLTNPNEATNELYDKMNALQDAFYATVEWPSDEEAADPNYVWPQFDMNTPEIQAEAEAEIAQAVADWGCKDKLDFEAETLKIQFEYETKFVSENKAELEAFRAAQEQQQR